MGFSGLASHSHTLQQHTFNSCQSKDGWLRDKAILYFASVRYTKQIQVLHHRTYTNNDLLVQQNSLYLGKRSCFSCEEIQQCGIFTLLSKLCFQGLNQLKLLLSLVRGVKYNRGSKLFSLKLNNSLVHISPVL